MDRDPGSTDYEVVAAFYDRRYRHGQVYTELGRALLNVFDVVTGLVLEVGCGTGHWVRLLRDDGHRVVGLDRSQAMLQRAADLEAGGWLRGEARRLPVRTSAFGGVLCVNALHHFPDPCAFLREAHRALAPGGLLAVVGMDPHDMRALSWSVYDYWPEALQLDRRRFPSRDQLASWMQEVGFATVETRVAERIRGDASAGRLLWSGPALRLSTSQLSALSDEEYAAGVRRLVAADQAAAGALCVHIDVPLHLTTAAKSL